MTFFVVIIIMTFLALLIQFVPGDPVRLVLGAKAPEAQVQAVRHEMYLDKPVPAQVYYFFKDAAQGNLGVDFQSQRPVTSLIWIALPHTVILAFASLLLAGLLGVPLGVYAATHPGGWLDRVTAVATISLITMPAYVAGLLLLLVFSVHWQIMPATGTGSLSNPADYARHLALPALALAVTISPLAQTSTPLQRKLPSGRVSNSSRATWAEVQISKLGRASHCGRKKALAVLHRQPWRWLTSK